MLYLQRQGFGDKYEIKPDVNVVHIGRNTASDIRFESTYVSRRHCEIKRIPPRGTLVIKNLTSNNRTHVDHIELCSENAEAELSIGSVIGLGVPIEHANPNTLCDKRFVFLKLCHDDPHRVPIVEVIEDCINQNNNNGVSEDLHNNKNVIPKSAFNENSNNVCIASHADDDIIIISDEDSIFVPKNRRKTSIEELTLAQPDFGLSKFGIGDQSPIALKIKSDRANEDGCNCNNNESYSKAVLENSSKFFKQTYSDDVAGKGSSKETISNSFDLAKNTDTSKKYVSTSVNTDYQKNDRSSTLYGTTEAQPSSSNIRSTLLAIKTEHHADKNCKSLNLKNSGFSQLPNRTQSESVSSSGSVQSFSINKKGRIGDSESSFSGFSYTNTYLTTTGIKAEAMDIDINIPTASFKTEIIDNEMIYQNPVPFDNSSINNEIFLNASYGNEENGKSSGECCEDLITLGIELPEMKIKSEAIHEEIIQQSSSQVIPNQLGCHISNVDKVCISLDSDIEDNLEKEIVDELINQMPLYHSALPIVIKKEPSSVSLSPLKSPNFVQNPSVKNVNSGVVDTNKSEIEFSMGNFAESNHLHESVIKSTDGVCSEENRISWQIKRDREEVNNETLSKRLKQHEVIQINSNEHHNCQEKAVNNISKETLVYNITLQKNLPIKECSVKLTRFSLSNLNFGVSTNEENYDHQIDKISLSTKENKSTNLAKNVRNGANDDTDSHKKKKKSKLKRKEREKIRERKFKKYVVCDSENESDMDYEKSDVPIRDHKREYISKDESHTSTSHHSEAYSMKLDIPDNDNIPNSLQATKEIPCYSKAVTKIEPIHSVDMESDSDDDRICYSQVNEVILLSSDEEHPTLLNDSLDALNNGSFGPLPSKESEFDAFLNEDPLDAYFDFGVDENIEELTVRDMEIEDSSNKEASNLAVSNSNNSAEDDTNDDEWWPCLSQQFFEEKSQTKPEVDTSKTKSYEDSDKNLKRLITKLGNRKITESKLTDPKLPPLRTKSNTLLKKGLPKLTVEVSNKAEDKLEKTSKEVSTQIHSTSKSKKKKSNIRSTLLKTHNLEPYKRSVEKENHHLLPQSYKKDIKKNTSSSTKLDKKKENISILPKPSTSAAEIPKKGIAKISKVSRNQKLAEIDIFKDLNTQPKPTSKFKIPKKRPDTSKNIETISETASVLKNRNIEVNDISFPAIAIPELSKTSKNEAQLSRTLKSILKSNPKPAMAMRYNVRFPVNAKDLVSIKMIPPRERRDCLGPQSIHSKEIFFNKNKSKSEVLELSPFSFVHIVCSWNYDWLSTYKEAKRSPTKRVHPPTVYPEIWPILTRYGSFNAYKETYSSLIFYEVWENVFRDWDQQMERNVWFVCEVDSNKCHFVKNLKFFKIKAFCFLSDKWRHPAVGSLIVMSNKFDSELFKQKNNCKKQFTFGYVENVNKRKSKCVSPYLKSVSLQDADTIVMFDILLSKQYIEFIKPGTIVSISNISYIRPSQRAFESLCNLQSSPLYKFIMDPSNIDLLQCDNTGGDYLIHQMEMNENQKNIIVQVANKCFHDHEKPKVSLIHGPPGTGKTRVITTLVSQITSMFKESGSSRNRRILLCAPSNAAIDELVLRLVKLKDIGININVIRVGVNASINPSVQEFSFDRKWKREFEKQLIPNDPIIQIELQNKKMFFSQALEDYEKSQVEKRPAQEQEEKRKRMISLLRSKEEFEKRCKRNLSHYDRIKQETQCKKKVLMKAEVIATTLTSCLTGSVHETFGNSPTSFSCCIVDEAGQCKETEIWFPLQLGIRKLVLVGDHLQLPATVISQMSHDKKLHQSLFERIYHHVGVERQRMDVVHSLNLQYRMHLGIWAFPSLHFYQNAVFTAPGISELRRHFLKPYLVFDMKSSEDRRVGGEISNIAEVSLIQSIIELHANYMKRFSIGVLTPYVKQKSLLTERLKHLNDRLSITVSTVDNFQGQEKDIIFCSFVRSNPEGKIGFVSDPQRLNVALTRACRSCFIVGDLSSLQSNGDWRALIDDAARRNLIMSFTPEMVRNRDLIYRLTIQ